MKACEIAKKALKENKAQLRNLEKSIDREIYDYSKNAKKDLIVNEDNFKEIENLLIERKEFNNLESVLKSNDLINEVSKKYEKENGNILSMDDLVVETITDLIHRNARTEMTGNAYVELSKKMLDKQAFRRIVKNTGENAKVKADIERNTIYNKSDLKSTDIDKLKQSKESTMKADDEKLSEGVFIDNKDVDKATLFELFKGNSSDFMTKLFNKTGDSIGAKNLVMALLTNKWGYYKVGDEIVPFKQALDNKLRNVLNNISSEYDQKVNKIFEEETKDLGKLSIFEKSKLNRKLHDDFKRDMYLRQSDPSHVVNPKFDDIISYMDNEYDKLYQLEIKKYGEFNKQELYSPISHSRKNVDNFVSKVGHSNAVDFFTSAIVRQIEKELETTLIEGQVLNIRNIANDYVHKMTSESVIKNSVIKEKDTSKIFEDILKNVKEDPELVKLLAEKGFDKSKQSFQQTRIRFDYGYEETIDNVTYRMIDMMDDNHFDVVKGNIVERNKKLETELLNIKLSNGEYKQIDIFDDDSIENAIKYLNDFEDLPKEFNKEFAYILNDLRRSQFIEKDLMDGIGNQYLRTIRNFSTATMLGSVLLPSFVEFGLVVNSIGISGFLKANKEYKQFLKDISDGNLDLEMKKELKDVLYINASERFQATKNSLLADTETNYLTKTTTKLDKAENFTTGYADVVVNKVNMLSKFTAYTKGVATMGYVKRLRDGGELSLKRHSEIGWTKSEYNLFVDKLRTYDEDLPISEMLHNMKKDLTKEEYDLFEYGILRKGDNLVLNPNIGEGYSILNKSPIGKLLLAFQNYITQAFTKMFLKGFSHHDAEAIGGFMVTMFMSSLVEMAKEGSKLKDPFKDYKDLNVMAITNKAIRNSSHMANVPYWTDLIMNLLGINTNIGSRHFNNKINDFGDVTNRTVVGSKFNQANKLKNELVDVAIGEGSGWEVAKKAGSLLAPDLARVQSLLKAIFD